MKNKIKQIFSLFLSVNLIYTSAGFAAIVGTPELANSNGSVTCTDPGTTEYFPLGDTRGFNVLTKKEEVRDCEIVKQTQGECIRWNETDEDRSLSAGQYDTYESKNYSDSLGSLLAALGAYDQIEHLWSGWKGYCEIGTKSDFSWAEDPMFWASMAMSMLMQSTAPAANGEPGLLQDTAVGNSFNGMADSVGQSVGDVAQSAGTDLAEGSVDAALDAGLDSGQIASTAAWDSAVETATQEFYNSLGRCMIAAGFETLVAAYEFGASDDGSSIACDPVDEVCGTEASATSESDVMTMDEVQFNDLVQQFTEMDPPSNIFDYVYVIPPSPTEGIVSFRMKQLNEFEDIASMDQAALDELQAKIKEAKMYMSLAATALSLAACTTGISSADVSQPTTDSDRADLRMGAGMAINFAAKFMGPYGPIIAAVLKVILYVATSYKSIDSCHNEDDAKEISKRHERTQKALEFDLCHLIKIECAEYSVLAGSFLQNDCVLDGYYYCCYDQVMSKILVEQLKAQLGRDWAHCTGISLRDLNYVSFQQCSVSEMTDSSTIDGAHQIGEYDPTKAFQYKYKCIDMTEFLEYLKATAGMDIDMSDFEDFWNDITEQYPDGGPSY